MLGFFKFGGIYGAGEPLPDSQSDSAPSSKLFSCINRVVILILLIFEQFKE